MPSGATAALPEVPTGIEFEEYVAAHLHAKGYHVERNIVERDPKEVLELDIIATDYEQAPPEIMLVEVKSGDYGFADLFKVRGWMHYLGLSRGIFIAKGDKEDTPLFDTVAERLGIDLVQIPELSACAHALACLPGGEDIDDRDLWAWRFSSWARRKLLQRLKQQKRACPAVRRFGAMDAYHFRVTSGIFFAPTIVERVDALYSAFQEHPRLSAKCGHEMQGGDFETDHLEVPKEVYAATYYDREYTDVQISTFIEHLARVTILKGAIDYVLFKKAGAASKADTMFHFLGLDLEMPLLELLPSSFQEGLETISHHSHFHRYAIFWQWFLWVFGGFILKDYEAQEYELLARKTRMPVDQVPNALEAYAILFPQEGGWFADLSPASNIIVTKLFSVPFMGVGANYRRWIYSESEEFSDLKVGTIYTLKDLIEWNNLLVEVLLT
jgi:hypothetical protein